MTLFFSLVGFPKLSGEYQETAYTSNFFRELTKSLRIEIKFSTLYHSENVDLMIS